MKEITFDPQPAPAQPDYTIGQAWLDVLRDPGRFVRQWNYKGAVMSGGLRAPIFLITYLVGHESIKLAVGAAAVQFAFRFLFAGVGGALIQSFRRVEPAWKALLTILLVVPVISHIIEFLVQSAFAYFTGTHDHTDEAIVRSICVSVISALFSLFIMRRDVMIVGEAESQSLFSDLSKFPVLIFQFVAFIPLEIAKMIKKSAWLHVILSFAAFAVFSQLICFAMTKKFFWTYGGGREIQVLKYWAADGTIMMIFAVVLAMIWLNQSGRKKIS